MPAAEVGERQNHICKDREDKEGKEKRCISIPYLCTEAEAGYLSCPGAVCTKQGPSPVE